MNQRPIKLTYLRKSATLAGAILLGLACSQTVNLWLGEQNASANANPTSTAQAPTEFKFQKIDYRKLESVHLFGKITQKVASKSEKKAIKAPETRLKLQLIGIIFYEESDDGLAIVSEPGKPQKTYHVGDKLPGDATLYAIEKGRIILDRNSRHEALTLKKPDKQSSRPSSRSNSPTLSRQELRRLPAVKRKTKFM